MTRLARNTACLLATLLVVGAVWQAHAGFVPSANPAIGSAERIADLDKVQRAIETRVVKERMSALGMSGEEIKLRIDGLSDAQVHQLALRFNELNTGGESMGMIVAVLVVAILVWAVFYLYGHRVIIK